MKPQLLHSRLWVEVTGFVLPLLAMAAYVLGWSTILLVVLNAACFAGICAPWIVRTDLRRWRVDQRVRLRAVARRCAGRRRP